MRRILGIFGIVCVWLSLPASSLAVGGTDEEFATIRIQDMTLTVPAGWSLQQNAKDEGTIILGFAKDQEYLTIYVKQQTGLDMKRIFNNGTTVVRDIYQIDRNTYRWKGLDTAKQSLNVEASMYVTSFMTEHQGFSYYGYARTGSQARSGAIVNEFLTALR